MRNSVCCPTFALCYSCILFLFAIGYSLVASLYHHGILDFTMKKMSHFFTTTQGQFLGSVGLIIVLLFAYYFYETSTNPEVTTPADITISTTDHVKGAKNGTVTLVEFADFQCPACSAWSSIVQQAMNDNKDTLKVVFRNFPLTQIHRNALPAAKAAEAAALQGKFWEMHDMLYQKQQEWSGALNVRDYFLTYATTLRLDTKKFVADMDSKAVEEKILAEMKEAVRLDVPGTPTFFVNGKKMENVTDLASFNKVIKEAAAEAVK